MNGSIAKAFPGTKTGKRISTRICTFVPQNTSPAFIAFQCYYYQNQRRMSVVKDTFAKRLPGWLVKNPQCMHRSFASSWRSLMKSMYADVTCWTGIVNKVNRVNTATAFLLILCLHHYINKKIFIKLTHMFYIISNMIISTQTPHTESIYTEAPRRDGATQKYLRVGRAKRK